MLLATVPATDSFAQPSAESHDPEAVIRAMFAAINSGDVDGALALMTDDVITVNIPPPLGFESAKGKPETGEWLETFVARNGQIDVREIYVHGDKVAFAATVTEDFFTELGCRICLPTM